jgi:hypothetical protein
MAKKESWTPLLKSYPHSQKINRISMNAEATFVRLLARCDDRSTYLGDPKKVCARLFTDRWAAGEVSVDDVGGWLDELAKVELIVRFKSKGEEYIFIPRNKKMLRKDIKEEIRFQPVPVSIAKRYRPDNGPPPSYSSTSSPSLPQRNEYQPEFETFWQDYPRKINKSNAYGKWKARMKEGVEPIHIMTCLAGYLAQIKAEETPLKFTLHASTFLNADHRFNDFKPTARQSKMDAFCAKHKIPDYIRDDIEGYIAKKRPILDVLKTNLRGCGKDPKILGEVL